MQGLVASVKPDLAAASAMTGHHIHSWVFYTVLKQQARIADHAA